MEGKHIVSVCLSHSFTPSTLHVTLAEIRKPGGGGRSFAGLLTKNSLLPARDWGMSIFAVTDYSCPRLSHVPKLIYFLREREREPKAGRGRERESQTRNSQVPGSSDRVSPRVQSGP